MSQSQCRHDISALIVVLTLMLLMATYLGGYLLLGEAEYLQIEPQGSFVTRCYPAEWLAKAFHPLARIEAWLSGAEVMVVDESRRGQDFSWTPDI